MYPLTIVGAVRESLLLARRERCKKFCARVALDTPAGGRSTSPLERSMTRQQAPVAAVIVGVALAVALRYGQGELNKHLRVIGAAEGIPNWLVLVRPPLQALVVLLPGFVSGWLASRRELLCGFLTGLFGAALYSAMSGDFWRSAAAGGTSEVFFLMGWLLSNGVSGGLLAGAAAGTAQLLRSNNRWWGP
jgi:hypothetical protein